ncbi:MAG TPA: PIN domain-containing protein [Gemmatimonadaceae bacterium]|nr:PIN domain-containing protein [Gemmatimonadaceae bacterium]
MARELFVDTSAWYALVDSGERSRPRVAKALREAIESRYRVVTTNLILAETHALLLRRFGREVALAFLREIRSEPNVVVESCRELEEGARRDWLERFEDQDFSFTDAVSFAVMSERRISSALTLDHHFAVAGFEVKP